MSLSGVVCFPFMQTVVCIKGKKQRTIKAHINTSSTCHQSSELHNIKLHRTNRQGLITLINRGMNPRYSRCSRDSARIHPTTHPKT